MPKKPTPSTTDDSAAVAGDCAEPQVPRDYNTKVALIVLCRNEENHIASCLDSLLANDYDQKLMDIVVVDGMSTDRTREIVADYCNKYDNIRMVDNPRNIKPAALNIGIAATTADVVMRIDAHAVYALDYISKLLQGLAEHGADNIGALRETDVGDSAWQNAIGIVVSHPFGAGNSVHRTGIKCAQPRRVDTVFPGCFRRNVFNEIGYFNEQLIRAQDREFNERMSQHGLKIVLDPSVKCTYYPRTRLGDYIRWTFSGGFWVFYARRFTDTKMVRWRNLIPLLFIVWHLVALGCGLLFPPLLPFVTIPIVAYWILNVFVSAKVAWKQKNLRFFPYMLLLFSSTHYAYGFGALYGFGLSRIRGKQRAT